MAKVPHITQSFGSSSYHTTRTTPEVIQTHTAPNLPSDTVARTLVSFHFAVSIDPTGNPPPIEWWHTARLNLAMQWNPGGSGSASSNENDSAYKARWLLYPEPYYDLATNDLYGVRFTPRRDVLETEARHKGDGVNMGKLLWVLHYHDSYGVLTNAGSTYSAITSFAIYSKVIWESDT